MSSEYNLNDDFAKADPTLPSSMKDNGPFDPIRDAVNEKSTDFITKGLDTFQKTSFSTEISTTNATEAILNYLDDNYNSFSANEDFSYTSMNLKDTKHFVQNIDKAYGEISHSCSDVQSLNFTLAKFLTGNQLSVLPTKGMLRYYNIKNFVTNGLFTAQGFSNAGVAKTLPVCARSSYLLSGPQILGTSFILGSAFSILEDIVPWRIPKIALNTLKWTSLLPAKGAEVVINQVLKPIETLSCGISIPSNGTKALISGPGLTIKDITRKEAKEAIEIALKTLRDQELNY